MKNGQDPNPRSIITGLQNFYKAYDENNILDEQTLNQLATEYAGREANLWQELITEYEGATPPEEHISQLVEAFDNPFLSPDLSQESKKKTYQKMVGVLEMFWMRAKHLYRISLRITSLAIQRITPGFDRNIQRRHIGIFCRS